jgi:hypothetical protein
VLRIDRSGVQAVVGPQLAAQVVRLIGVAGDRRRAECPAGQQPGQPQP